MKRAIGPTAFALHLGLPCESGKPPIKHVRKRCIMISNMAILHELRNPSFSHGPPPKVDGPTPVGPGDMIEVESEAPVVSGSLMMIYRYY